METSFDLESLPSQSDRVMVVTGANAGLGYETTLMLARKGATVVLACRNAEKATQAKAAIQQLVADAQLDVLILDLADLGSVRSFAQELRGKYGRLDVLVNNAGIMWVPQGTTADGFERHFGTNYLGHFLLTSLLFDLMPDTPSSRIVAVSSNQHKSARLDFDDLQSQKSYSKTRAYGRSKLANMIFAIELQRRLDDAGRNILSVAAHPGSSIDTALIQNKMLKRFLKLTVWFMNNPPKESAKATVMAALDPAVRGGDYFGPQGFGGLKGPPGHALPAAHAQDADVARKLWAISDGLTGARWPFESQTVTGD